MFKKLFSLFAALTLSAGLWAEMVAYLNPVYNDPTDVTKGIKEWKNATADAIVVENATEVITWGTAGTTTWYVVTGTDVQLAKGAVCNGAVNLILADGAKLTVKGKDNDSAGIKVSGEGNSLTIYGQTAQSGQLIATGGTRAAGIGGGAGGNGTNITINGGTVTATSGGGGAGIGGGEDGSASNIFVATSLVVKADGNNPPTTVITNTGADLASSLAGKRYVMVETGGAKYFAKNNWNGASADSWSWLEMYQTNMKNVYMLDSVVFGGTGVHINTKEEDADALWFAEDKIGVRNGLDGLPVPYIPEPRKHDTVLYAPHRVAKPLQFNTLQAGDTIKLFFNISDSTLSTLIIGRPGSTALPTVFGEGMKGNKFMHNGQLIIRKNGKTYNALGF